LTDCRYLLAEKGGISAQEPPSPCWRYAAACDLTTRCFSEFLPVDPGSVVGTVASFGLIDGAVVSLNISVTTNGKGWEEPPRRPTKPDHQAGTVMRCPMGVRKARTVPEDRRNWSTMIKKMRMGAYSTENGRLDTHMLIAAPYSLSAHERDQLGLVDYVAGPGDVWESRLK